MRAPRGAGAARGRVGGPGQIGVASSSPSSVRRDTSARQLSKTKSRRAEAVLERGNADPGTVFEPRAGETRPRSSPRGGGGGLQPGKSRF